VNDRRRLCKNCERFTDRGLQKLTNARAGESCFSLLVFVSGCRDFRTGHISKSSLPERVTWVQIPPSPPPFSLLTCLGNNCPLALFYRSVLRVELEDHIERIQEEFPGYGYRRLGLQLRREGILINDKRIRRVQRQYQLYPIRWQSFKIATTDSNHGHKLYPNLLAGLQLTGINQAWVADITYIRILVGFVYLAVLLDRYSCKVIGWAISRRIDAELCMAALRSALSQR
jgi:hypothetical protein